MALSAKLYADDRGSVRRAVSLDATARDDQRQPLDVSLENLSNTGFLMTTSAEIAVGSVFTIGVAGIPKRDARVTRRVKTAYGCEFLVPVSDVEIDAALTAETVVVGSFNSVRGDGDGEVAATAGAQPGKWPIPARLLIISLASAALWAIVIWVAAALI